VVELFTDQGDIEPDKVNRRGRTALSFAAELGNTSVLELLLERGDVNADLADNGGRTLLSYAAESGREGVVKLFLERGDVNADLPDNGGRTPLSYAAASWSEGVVNLLLERGNVNPNSLDNDGQTPLSYAVQRGYQPIINLIPNYRVPTRESSRTSVQTKDSVDGEKTPEKDGTHPLPLLHRTMSPLKHISSYASPPSLDLSRIGLLRNNLYRSHTLGQIIWTHQMPDRAPPPLVDPE
jgi:hypothetical protein